MEDSRFDAFTRRMAAPASRRAVVGGVSAGLAALTLRHAGAQDATPVDASPQAGEAMALLFVQSAGATTLARGDGDTHTLTMTGMAAQTLYFSNRPARMAGAMPTSTFAAAFPAAFAGDPPNAALIGHVEPGAEGEEAVIVELVETQYDPASDTLTWQVRIIAPAADDAHAFESAPLAALDSDREYAEAHLFIDDVDIAANDACKEMCAPLLPPGFDPAGIGHAAYWNCIFQCLASGG